MFIRERSRNRPFHWGTFPLETLPRDESIVAREIENARPPIPTVDRQEGKFDFLSRSAGMYGDIFAKACDGVPAPELAPVPDDPVRRTVDIKGSAYFMDADQVGICHLPESYRTGKLAEHTIAIVILLEHPRLPETDNLARAWIEPAQQSVMNMRAIEITSSIAGHIRNMGFAATAIPASSHQVDAEQLAVLSGLAVRDGNRLRNPYVLGPFTLGVVTTAYELAIDLPLHPTAIKPLGLRYWWGINGARSGRERNRRAKRATHLSRYPMETVRRVDRPTTLIFDDEVPRVPKRAAFFQRALHGDLGEKAQRERTRFAFKTPFSLSLLQNIRAMVPHQDGPIGKLGSGFGDAKENTKAIKSLSYYLGADLTGVCEIPRYAWFSHKEDGTEIPLYHKYAVVMLIDQGYDTMEAASGDDWVSGAQSMRGYLRGAEIAGVMGEFLRSNGIPARPQTNADSDVLQIPLVLLAGLGELSRIGELVLNPFVGPRFKSVVLTTDLPLVADKPIDFGLQSFCSNCLKCARECPCDAIPFGGKVMFNGYEMWKPDVERCTRYRLTNQRGAACGRCMKTCPINKVVDADGAWLTRAASWVGVNCKWAKPLTTPIATFLDDFLGHGKRNLVKKWWFDHEMVDGVAVDPPQGTNQRDIDPSRQVNATQQKMAYYNADMMPPPNEQSAVKINRKEGMLAKEKLETPAQARKRKANGNPAPSHYSPTPTTEDKDEEKHFVANPYR